MANARRNTQRPEPRRNRDRVNLRWYADKGEPHEAVMECVRKLAKQDDRRSRLLLWRDLFLDTQRRDYKRNGIYRARERARYNVIRSACETIAARVFKNQPQPEVITDGGNWKLQRKAKQMTTYLRGDIDRIDADAMRRAAGMDCLIFGTGCIKVYAEHGQVAWRRVWRGNLLIDQREEVAGSVRTLYEIMPVDREVLAEVYPKEARQIAELPSCPIDMFPGGASVTSDTDDTVCVAEAWRLPSSPSKSGRHVIVADGVTLLDEPWERASFPFAFLRYGFDPLRFWGIGIPEYLCGLQSEQNYLDEAISDGARLVASTRFLLENGATLSGEGVTNEIGEFWTVNGTGGSVVPIQLAPAAAQMMIHAVDHRRSLLEIIGVSPLSAQSQKPPGLNSGKAIQTYQDSESERFAFLGQDNERFTITLCKLHIDSSEEIVDDGDGAQLVAHAGKRTLDAIAYPDVRLGDNPYQVQVAPVSALPSTPAGKLAQVMEMLQGGFLSLEEARELYDFPDLDASNKAALAGRNLARKLVDSALEGKLIPAPRVVDKAFLLDWGWKQYSDAFAEGASDDDLATLVDLLGQVQGLVEQEAAEAAANAPAPPMAGRPIPPGPPGGGIPAPPGLAPFPPGLGPAPGLPNPLGVAA